MTKTQSTQNTNIHENKLDSNDFEALQRLIDFSHRESVQISIDYFSYVTAVDKWHVTAWYLGAMRMKSGKTLEDTIDQLIKGL